MSMPATSHPLASAIRAASCPTRPSPATSTFAPGPTSARRRPCSAIEATVAKAASAAGTPAGTGAHSRPGTACASAWLAHPAPPVATSCPAVMPWTIPPTSTTTPAALYPSGTSPPRRVRTARAAVAIPSARALRATCRTRSGRARAFATSPERASAVTARSVPGETTLATVRTSTSVGPIRGVGTSRTSTAPPRTACTTCFISILSPRPAVGSSGGRPVHRHACFFSGGRLRCPC